VIFNIDDGIELDAGGPNLRVAGVSPAKTA
jgi:hypothetical protein